MNSPLHPFQLKSLQLYTSTDTKSEAKVNLCGRFLEEGVIFQYVYIIQYIFPS